MVGHSMLTTDIADRLAV